jgi:hypothetical protein
MKFCFVTLCLIFGVFITTIGRVAACDHADPSGVAKTEQKDVEKSCCSESKDASASCADDSEHSHRDSSCPCDHANGGCNCPGCGTICHSGAGSGLEAPLSFFTTMPHHAVQKMAFYFAEHLPEAVYLPIWQPPQIAAPRCVSPTYAFSTAII